MGHPQNTQDCGAFEENFDRVTGIHLKLSDPGTRLLFSAITRVGMGESSIIPECIGASRYGVAEEFDLD